MRRWLIIPAIIILSLPAVLPFLQKGFFWTQDIIYLTRIYAMSEALGDGQFPVRWISVFRYGEPLFNYYAPFPYYLGAFIHFFGFDYLSSAKIIFILITVFSGIFMFLLAKEFWGKLGGLLSAMLYVYAPYRAVDLFIRGSLSEVFAFTWFPLIFWSVFKYYKTQKTAFLLLTGLSFSLLILTHNITAMIFLPFLLCFIFVLAVRKKEIRFTLSLLLSLILGLGLSAFYWIPAFFENNYVQTNTAILKFDFFINQFVKWSEFVKPQWDGTTITHELGPTALIFLFLSLLTSLMVFKKRRSLSFLIIFFLGLLSFSLFLQTLMSLGMWLMLSPLGYAQFPWRFSGISMFFLALIGGSAFLLLNKLPKLNTGFFIVSVIAILILQGHYFSTPKLISPATDDSFINLNEAFLPKEYLPSGVKENPPKPITSPVTAEDFEAINVQKVKKDSKSYGFSTNLRKPEEIVVPVYYFPGWTAFIENKAVPINKQPKTGLIILSVPSGENKINLIFQDTPLRQTSNLITLFSIFIFAGIYLFKILKTPPLLNILSLRSPEVHQNPRSKP